MSNTENNVVISIIATVYNEEEMLPAYLKALSETLSQIKNMSFEVIFVDDGSTDGSFSFLSQELKQSFPFHIRVIQFSRNFGKESAIKAGLDHAEGAAAIVMDADLEDPVELIPQLLDKWISGSDIVYTVRKRRFEGWFKRIFAWGFYKVVNHFSDVHIYHNAGDYRLFDRKAITALSRLPERNRFSKGLFNWIGFTSSYVEYDRYARKKGSSKWSFRQLWRYAMDGIISFSTVPLRLWIFIGSLISLGSFSYAAYLIFRVYRYGIDVPGYASTIVIMMFLNGIILINLGILSEYIARIFVEVKQRPSYLVKEILSSSDS